MLAFGAEGPERQDLCAACGQTVDEQARAFYWRSTRPTAGESRPVVDYAFLREMFERMLSRAEPVYQRLTYLVGLVLVRKRFLRLKGFEARNGREVMVLARGAELPDLEVPAPHLSADDMLQTRELLKRLLAADLPDSGDPLDAELHPDGESQLAAESQGAPQADERASPAAEPGAPSGSATSVEADGASRPGEIEMPAGPEARPEHN